jgi:hypothetical protein
MSPLERDMAELAMASFFERKPRMTTDDTPELRGEAALREQLEEGGYNVSGALPPLNTMTTDDTRPLDVEHYVGDGCDEHVLVRRVPSVRESSARLGITMTEHNAPDIVRPAPFEDDVLDLPPTIAEAYEQGMLAERARHAALVAAARALLRRSGGLTVHFAGGRGYVSVPSDWLDDLDAALAALRAALDGEPR